MWRRYVEDLVYNRDNSDARPRTQRRPLRRVERGTEKPGYGRQEEKGLDKASLRRLRWGGAWWPKRMDECNGAWTGLHQLRGHRRRRTGLGAEAGYQHVLPRGHVSWAKLLVLLFCRLMTASTCPSG